MTTLALHLARARAGQIDHTRSAADTFARIDDYERTAPRVFTKLFRDQARTAARALDEASQVPALAGVTVSVKDAIDVAGAVTTAGSRVLADQAPAAGDAPVVARLRRAGAIVIGATTMTEFAFGALGINEALGTPHNPFDAALIPGGSSSGAAVSVARGFVLGAIGTDTAGSVQVPAAFCGVTGFKSTAARLPREGVVPLSRTLDSIGCLGRTVDCCARLDAALAGVATDVTAPPPPLLRDLSFAVPRDVVLDDLEPAVARAFSTALARLSAAGASIEEIALPELREIPLVNKRGLITYAEAHALHRRWVSARADRYQAETLERVQAGAAITEAELREALAARARLIDRCELASRPYAALLAPTVPCVAPALAPLLADAARRAVASRQVIRNTSMANFLDRCALTMPCQAPGDAPVGLMLIGRQNADRALLAAAAAIEPIILAAADSAALSRPG